MNSIPHVIEPRFTFDYNGNTLTKVVGSNTTSFSWDFENRLTSVTLPGNGGTVSFKYDPAGLLVVQLIVAVVLAAVAVRSEITGGLISSVDDGAAGGGGGRLC